MPKIQFKRGLKTNLPQLSDGEPGFTTDTGELFIGSPSGNVNLAKKDDVDNSIQNLQTDVNTKNDERINDISSVRDIANSVKDQFDRVVAEAGSNNPEVVQARGGEVNLNARLENFNAQLAETEKHTDGWVNAKSYGALSDGVTDDSQAVLDAFNDAITNKKNLKIPRNTLIGSPLVLDALGNKIDIEAHNITFSTSGFTIKNAYDSSFTIGLFNGGDNTENSIGILLQDILGCTANIKADSYKGTVLRCGIYDTVNLVSRRVRDCKITLITRDCYRALIHGDSHASFTQGMFGTYDFISDRNSDNGTLFYNSYDIGITHYENSYGKLGNSVYFKECYAHIGTLAIGGVCDYLLYIAGKNQGANPYNRIEVSIAFVNSENTATNGIYVTDSASFLCGLLYVQNGTTSLTVTETAFQVSVDRLTVNGVQPVELVNHEGVNVSSGWNKGSVMQFSNYHQYVGGTTGIAYVGNNATQIQIGKDSTTQRIGFFAKSDVRQEIRTAPTTATATDTINKLNELITKLDKYGLIKIIT